MSKDTGGKLNLIIELDGVQIDDGIDLFELAPALLSLGETIKRANDLTNPEKREIGVNVRPFGKGSFIIDISLFARTNLERVLEFVSGDKVQQIKTLLEWMGLVVGSTSGLIQLVKWLKGKPPKKIEKLQSGDVKYTSSDGTSVNVNINVHNLYKDEEIHKHFYSAYGKLLEKDYIDSYKAFVKGCETSDITNTKEDLDSFLGYSEGGFDVLTDSEREILYKTPLNFKRGSYEGMGDNWSFRKGTETVIATIKDLEFLQKIKNGEIRPYTKDYLEVEMKEIVKIRGTEVLPPTYEIMKVIEYRPVDKSTTLFGR